MNNLIAYAGLVALVVLAIVGKSAVMLFSVLGMGCMFWITRNDSLSKQIMAAASGALLTSWGAEAAHTVYHVFASQSGEGGDHGFFFVGATLVGLINAIALTTLVLAVNWLTEARKRL